MKRLGNLYDNICKIENIKNAYNEMCRNTRNKIKVENLKQYKSIYISRIARQYIEDLHDVMTIGQIFQAKIINDDFYEKPWGWELSKIF